ncbi:MAG: DUF2905 domain-containing protein [Deltaproteobacteria bacterium]|nr:DUF2905 domain-containing protein [Deltaproteobacteria bacterium]
MTGLGKSLIIIGIIIVIIGLFMAYGQKVPFLGKLPGDIHIKRENFEFYFPLATSIIVSVIISVILYFFMRR